MAEKDLSRIAANATGSEGTSATQETSGPGQVQDPQDQEQACLQYDKLSDTASSYAQNGGQELPSDPTGVIQSMEQLTVHQSQPETPTTASAAEPSAVLAQFEGVSPTLASVTTRSSVVEESQAAVLSASTAPSNRSAGSEPAAGRLLNKQVGAESDLIDSRTQELASRRLPASSSSSGEAASGSSSSNRGSGAETSDSQSDPYQSRHTRPTHHQHQHRSDTRRGQARTSSNHYASGSVGGAGGRGHRQGYSAQGNRGPHDSRGEGRQGGRQPNIQQRLERALTMESPGPSAPAPSTDLERFLVQVTPMLQLDQTQPQEQAMCDLLLEDVWRFYCEPSLYGREVYTLGGLRGPSLSYFVPFLSAMQLYVPASPGDPGTRKLYVSDVEGWPKHMHLVYQYFEREMPFNRTPMYPLVQSLSSRQGGSVLMQTRIAQLHPASWFAVAWYPVYRIPDAPLCARFLTFHSFAPLVMSIVKASQAQHQPAEHREQQLAQPVVALQVIGLKWYNMHNERWFDNITDTPDITSSPEPGAASPGSSSDGVCSPSNADGPARGASSNGGVLPSASSRVAQRGQRGGAQTNSTDYMWQAHISELQATADRLARGIGVRILGQMGAEDANLNHPDYEFFKIRS